MRGVCANVVFVNATPVAFWPAAAVLAAGVFETT
jgi:hypothetical protein